MDPAMNVIDLSYDLAVPYVYTSILNRPASKGR